AGWDTFRSMQAGAEGRVQVAFLLGGNLFASNPDRAWAARALGNVPFTIYASTKLNEGHVHGRGRTTLVLPVLARDEEKQATTQESMFSFVRLSEGGAAAEGEMRSEVDILASLAERVLPPSRFDWAAMRSHQRLREEIGRVVPGYGAIAAIDRTREEFQIGGPTFPEPAFPPDSGRARFHVIALPGFAPEGDGFRLMTLRSEGQFNTVVYEEEDLYRGNSRRDVVMMTEEDAPRLVLEEGDAVDVVNDTGRMRVLVAFADLPPGNLA